MVGDTGVTLQGRPDLVVEHAHRDDIIPECLGHGLHQVARIIVLWQVLEQGTPQVKGVVECGAGAHGLDEGESRVLDALHDQVGQVLGIA